MSRETAVGTGDEATGLQARRRPGRALPVFALNSGFTIKDVVVLFLGVVALYFGVFYGIEFLRHRRGPWVLEFQAIAGTPAVSISQDRLGVTNVTLVFRGESLTNRPGRVSFDRVRQPLPYGRLLYEDLTFLPGVLTFDLFGHEIELLPRVLVANNREIAWRSGSTVELWPTNKPAVPPQPPNTRRR